MFLQSLYLNLNREKGNPIEFDDDVKKRETQTALSDIICCSIPVKGSVTNFLHATEETFIASNKAEVKI